MWWGCFYFKLGGHRRLFCLFAIYLCKDPISKHGHFKRYWVLGLYRVNLEGHSSNHTYVTCCCCCLVTQSCLTLCNPMDCSTSGFPVLHYLLEFAQPHESVIPSNHLILCHKLHLFDNCVLFFLICSSFFSFFILPSLILRFFVCFLITLIWSSLLTYFNIYFYKSTLVVIHGVQYTLKKIWF